jgi:hypothetical protein
MGRGLSELQKTILRRALSNRNAEGRQAGAWGADVYRAEILADYWGWKMHAYPPFYQQERSGWQRRAHASQRFSRRRIGAARYDAAQAAVTRAFQRLADRGLVELRCGAFAQWSGASLTEIGVNFARNLSAKCSATYAEDLADRPDEAR